MSFLVELLIGAIMDIVARKLMPETDIYVDRRSIKQLCIRYDYGRNGENRVIGNVDRLPIILLVLIQPMFPVGAFHSYSISRRSDLYKGGYRYCSRETQV
jgi:hypothetical protein